MNIEEYSRQVYSVYEKLRDRSGMKDSDVAKETGIAREYLSMWKHGKSFPKIDKVIKIADLFQVSLDYLFQREQG